MHTLKPFQKDERPTWQINQSRFDRRLAHNNNQATDPDGHWFWISTVFKRGDRRLPYFWIKDPGTLKEKQVYARRWAWESTHGPLPAGNAVVNVCGEPLCVCPEIEHNRPMLQGQWLSPERGKEILETPGERKTALEDIPPAHVIRLNDEVIE